MNGISIQESEHEFLKRLALALETNPIFISTFSAVATAFVPILLIVAYTSFGKTKSVESTKFLGLRKRNTVKAFTISIALITGLLLITDIQDPIRFSFLVLLVIPFAFFAFHFRARDELGTNGFPTSTDSKVDMALPVVASFVALASISQIFPVHDPYHLWWAAPIPIVSAILCGQFLTNLGVIESNKGLSGTLVVFGNAFHSFRFIPLET
jgi:cation transport ATPase